MENNLPLSQWTKKATNSFTDIMLVVDKIKKHKAIPTKVADEIIELKKLLPDIESNIVKRDLFKLKMNLILRDVYALVKDSNLFTKKEKKEFRKDCKDFIYSSPNSVAVKSSYERPRQVGFAQSFGHVSQRESGYMSMPDFRTNIKLDNPYTKIHEGTPKFDGVPDIVLTRLAFNKIKIWCESLDDEIQALGIVELQEGGIFLVKDFFLFDQIVSKTVCEEKNAQALVDLMIEVESKGYNSRDLKCWWHSHNSMGVTPSAQDIRTTEKYGASGFLISLISNHSGQFNSKISFTKPFTFEIVDVPVLVMDESLTTEFVDQQQALIRKHVETRKYSGGYFSGAPAHYQREPYYSRPEPLIQDYGSELYHHQTPAENKVSQETGVRTEKEFEEMFEDAVIVAAVEKGEAPFENSFQEGDICYTWNVLKRRYDFTNTHGRVLTSKELEDMGAADYNKTIDEAIEAMKNGNSSTPSSVEGA